MACAPHAWAVGSAFLLLQACLGVGVGMVEHQVWFDRPRRPAFVPELRIMNLSVALVSVDLLLFRHADDLGVNVLRRVEDLSVVVAR